jgi:hypothetical protein
MAATSGCGTARPDPSRHGAQDALGSLVGVRVAAADGQRATGADDLALGDTAFAARRRQQVDLEVDGQHLCVLRHWGQRGVTAGAVESADDDARVEEAVLLRETRLDR